MVRMIMRKIILVVLIYLLSLISASSVLAGILTASGTSYAPSIVIQGDQDVVMEQLAFTVDTGSVVIDSIKVDQTGTAGDTDVDRVELFDDANGNGVIDTGEAQVGSSLSFSSGTTTFSGLNYTVDAGTPRYILIVYDVANLAPGGNTLKARLLDNTYITVDVGNTVSTANFPIESDASTIRGKLTVEGYDKAPTEIARTSEDVVMLQLKFTASSGAGSVYVDTIKIDKTGTAADTDVSAVKLYDDANNNGTYEVGTDVLLASGTFVSGSVTFSALNYTVTEGTAEFILVTFDGDSTATFGNTVGGELVDNTYVTPVNGERIIFPVAPISSSTSTFTQEVLTVSGTDKAPAKVFQSDTDIVMEQLTLSLNVGKVTVTSVKIDKSGTSTQDSDVAQAYLYDDVTDVGNYNPGQDVLLASDTFTSGTLTFSALSLDVEQGTDKNLLVLYDISATAEIGKTVGVTLVDSSYFTITPTWATVSFSVSPIQSTNSYIANKLTVGGTSYAPVYVGVNQTDIVMEQLSLDATPNDIILSALKVDLKGTGTDTDISLASLIEDADGDGVYDAGETLLSTAAFSLKTLTFSNLNYTVPVGTTKYLLIVYDISVDASPDNTVGVDIQDETYFDVGQDGVSGTFPIFSSESTIVSTVSVAGTSLAPSQVVRGRSKVPIEKLTFTVDGGLATVTQINVKKTGTSTNDSDISLAYLYDDTNDNGVYDEVTDTLLATSTFSLGMAYFNNLTYEINEGIPENALILYDISATADTDVTVGAELTDSSYVVVASPDLIDENSFPISSNTTAIAKKLTVSGDSTNTPAGIIRGQGKEMYQLKFDVDGTLGSKVTITSLKIARAGSGSDSDVKLVSLYDDANGDWSTAGDTLLGTGTFSYSHLTFDLTTADYTVPVGTTKYMIVVYDIAADANTDVTVGVKLQDASYVGVKNTDGPPMDRTTVSSENFPLSSTPLTEIGGKLTVSGIDIAPAEEERGKQYVNILQLGLAVDSGSITVDNVKVNLTGTGTDSDIGWVKIYEDTNASGSYDGGEPQLASSVFSAGEATLTINSDYHTITASSSPKYWLILYAISPTAGVGNTVGAELTDSTFITLSSNDSVEFSSSPISSSNLVITGNKLDISAAAIAPRNVNKTGGITVSMMNIRLYSKLADIYVDSVKVKLAEAIDDANLTSPAAITDITSVHLYDNTDCDNIVDAGETELGIAGGFDATRHKEFTNLNYTVNKGTTKCLLLTVDVPDTATAGNQVELMIDQLNDNTNSYVQVVAPNEVNPNNQTTRLSGITTLKDVDTLTVKPTNLAPFHADNTTTPLEMLWLRLSVYGTPGTNYVEINSITIEGLGTDVSSDIIEVALYDDSNENKLSTDEPPESLLGTADFSTNPVTINLAAPYTVDAGTDEYIIVTYKLASSPTAGNIAAAKVTDIDVGLDDLDTSNQPWVSTYMTIEGNAVEVSAYNLVDEAEEMPQGKEKAFLKLKFRAFNKDDYRRSDYNTSLENVTVKEVKIDEIGTCVANTDISKVSLYEDSNRNYSYDSGVDSLLASGNFDATSSISLSGFNISLSPDAEKEKYAFIVLNISNDAEILSPTLTADASAGTKDITVSSVTGVEVGDYVLVGVNTGNPERRQVQNISANTLTLSSNLTFDHFTDEIVEVNPTVATKILDKSYITAKFTFNSVDYGATVSTVGAPFNSNKPYITGNSLLVSDTSVIPSQVSPGDTDVPVLKLNLSTSYGSIILNSLKVEEYGSADGDIDVSKACLYDDANDNGSVDAGETKLAEAFFSSEQLTFSGLNYSVTADSSKTLLITYDINIAADGSGVKVGAKVSDKSWVTVDRPDSVLAATFPLSSNTATIRDLVTVTPTNLAPNKVSTGQQKVGMLKLKFDVATQYARITGIKVSKTGTSTDDADLSKVSIYEDADDDGIIDDGEVELGASSVVSGEANITGLYYTINTGTPKSLIVAYDISTTATAGYTVGAELGDISFITLESPDEVKNVNFPISSTSTTILAYDTLIITGESMAPTTATPGSKVVMEKLSLSTETGSVVITNIKIEKYGTADHSTAITEAILYEDSNDNSAYDEATDLQLATSTFDAGSQTANFALNYTINSTASCNLFIAYRISDSAPLDETVGVYLRDNTYVTVDTSSQDDVVQFSPYDWIVSDQTTISSSDILSVTGTDISPASIAQGQKDVLAKFTLSAGSGKVTVSSMKIKRGGTGNDSDVNLAYLYDDSNANGVYDEATDILLSSSTFSSTYATFSNLNYTVTAGTNRDLFVVYKISSTGTVGETVGVYIEKNDTDPQIVVESPDTLDQTNLPQPSPAAEIEIAESSDTLTVSGVSLAPTEVGQGQTEIVMEKLNLSITSGTGSVTITSIKIEESGSSTMDTDIEKVSLYDDANNNGEIDAGETLLATSSFSSQTATLNGISYTVSVDSDRYLLIAYDISSSATLDETVAVSLVDNTYVTLSTTADTVATTNFPISSSSSTIVPPPDTLTVAGVDLAPASVTQGQTGVVMEKLQFSAGSGSITITELKIEENGSSSADSDIAEVKVYEDSNNNGVVDTDEVLIGSGVFATGIFTLSGLSYTITSGTDKYWLIVYDIATDASTGVTIGVKLTDNTYIKVLSPDTVATTNFPLESSQPTIGGNTLTVSGDNLAPATTFPGDSITMLKLNLNVSSGSVTITKILANKTGTSVQDSDISEVKLYEDANNNGILDAGETLLSTANFSSSSTTLSGFNYTVDTASDKHLLLIYQISSSADTGVTVGAELTDNTYVVVESPDAVATTNFPIASGTTNIEDNTPPAAITDLAASAGTNTGEVVLTWTAPGDDDTEGTATSYDIRYHTVEITESNFDSAVSVSNPPTPQTAGSSETFTVTGLTAGQLYYFAIKTADEVPNISSVSNSPSCTAPDKTPPEITHTAISTAPVEFEVEVIATITDNLAVSSSKLYYRQAGTTTFSEVNMTADGSTYSAKIPSTVVTKYGVEYYLQAEDTSGNIATYPATNPTSLPQKIGTFYTSVYPNSLTPNNILIGVIYLASDMPDPTATATQDNATTVNLIKINPDDNTPPIFYSGTYPLKVASSTTCTIKVNGYTVSTFTAQRVKAKEVAKVVSVDKNTFLDVKSDTFTTDDTIITIIPATEMTKEENQLKKEKLKVSLTYQEDKLIYPGLAYHYGPWNVDLNNEILLTLKYKEAELKAAPADKLGIYIWNEKNNIWKYIGGKIDEENKTTSTAIDKFATYRLIADLVKPTVSNISPAEGEMVLTKVPTITASLSDLGSGVNPEGIQVILDNKEVKATYDEDSGIVTYQPTKPLPGGEHNLTIQVKDKVGNLSKKAEVKFQSPGPITLTKVHNYPNPVGRNQTIKFFYNLNESAAPVTIEIYNIAGKLITRLDGNAGRINGPESGDYIREVSWGELPPLANGVYIYRVVAKDPFEGKTVSAINKLAIVR